MPCEACGLDLADRACSPLHAGPLAMCAVGVNPTDLTGGQPVTAWGAVVSSISSERGAIVPEPKGAVNQSEDIARSIYARLRVIMCRVARNMPMAGTGNGQGYISLG